LITRAPRLKRNAAVGSYRIIQFVGSDDVQALYLANKGDPNDFY
jgi:hypothetical protein